MDKKSVESFHKVIQNVRAEVKKIVVGQDHVVTGVLRGLIADGHILVEGIPGIAKTLLIRTIAKVTGCQFGRVQFTVDLLPTDIVGLQSYVEGKGFFTIKGPIFANFLLADEINRAPPKTQSALLEAMQEKQVTIGKERFPMLAPFFVMATQNPIEQEGTYRLPEAQLDRFLFKVTMSYPTEEEEKQILKTNITLQRFEDFALKAVTSPMDLLKMQALAKTMYTSPEIENYIIKIVEATRNPNKYKLRLAKYIEIGCSPRASIGMFIGSKAEALIKGKTFVTPQHVKDVALDVMRHRLILTYEAEADNVTPDDILKEILSKVPVP